MVGDDDDCATCEEAGKAKGKAQDLLRSNGDVGANGNTASSLPPCVWALTIMILLDAVLIG